MIIFRLPDLGEGLPDAEIIEWYVKEGDTVEADQPLVSMETAKATVDIPSPHSGKVIKLHGDPHDIIQTGEPLVTFEGEGQETASGDSGTVVGQLETGDEVLHESPTGIQTASTESPVKALPAVRALARNLGVDLKTVTPTGKGGGVTADDVRNAHSHEDYRIVVLKGVRRAMSISMDQIYTGVAHATLMDDADIETWQDAEDFTLRLIRAVVAACKAEPYLNAHYNHESQSLKVFEKVNIGLAVDTPDGLYVPVIQDAANRGSEDIRETINLFKDKARQQSFRQDELQDSTIALSNYGTMAGRYATPVIVPPKVAIVGVGSSRKSVVAVNDVPAIHRMLPISLTFDHRALTGGESARFMSALIADLQR